MDINLTLGVAEQGIKLVEKLVDEISEFNEEAKVANNISEVQQQIVEILNQVQGMTLAHSRDFVRATPLFKLKDGTVVKIYKNPVGVEHIFLANDTGEMVFAGFVGWIHTQCLKVAIQTIKREFGV
ncbi:MAG: hypothetical protein ICV78_17370 [Tolypothrix sp. Co-bin9]|nr:hypothetical protein [Tolypothrix sp. Co-bin9]